MENAAAAAGSGNGFTSILLLVLLFGVVWFMLIRPQQKRRREAVDMQNTLGAGDRIVTIGGLYATVVSIEDDVVTVEIAEGVEVQFARQAIARTLPKEEAADEEPEAEAEAESEPPVEAKLEEPPVQSPVVDLRNKD